MDQFQPGLPDQWVVIDTDLPHGWAFETEHEAKEFRVQYLTVWGRADDEVVIYPVEAGQ